MESQSFISVQVAQNAAGQDWQGRMLRPVLVFLSAFVRSRAVPQQPLQHFQQLLMARGGSAAGSSEAGDEGVGSLDTSLVLICHRDTNAQELSEALGDFAISRMCIPMCKEEAVFGECTHQMLPKTMSAISLINQEAVGGSA